MSQFVVFYPKYWSVHGPATPSPVGMTYTLAEDPDTRAEETWAIIGSYDVLADAYAAADAASSGSPYLVEIYDRDNLAKFYATSPALTSYKSSSGPRDVGLDFLTSQMTHDHWLAWERGKIVSEIFDQYVAKQDSAGNLLNDRGGVVTSGFFMYPTDMGSWLAALGVATTRARISGQTPRDSAVDWARFGYSAGTVRHWPGH